MFGYSPSVRLVPGPLVFDVDASRPTSCSIGSGTIQSRSGSNQSESTALRSNKSAARPNESGSIVSLSIYMKSVPLVPEPQTIGVDASRPTPSPFSWSFDLRV